MNNSLHEQLNVLRLIARLREGQSLYINNGVNVYEFNYWNWVSRKWNRDNKDEVTRFLQEFYKSVDQSADQIINELKNDKDNFRNRKILLIICDFALTLRDSIKGIESLTKTYIYYPKTVSILEGVIKDYLLFTYRQLVEVIPDDMLSKELCANINFGGVPIYSGKNSEILE